MEHRWGLRRRVSRPVHLWTSGGLAARGDLTSVSISGAFIKTTAPLPLLARIWIRLSPLPGKAIFKGSLEALVVRGGDSGSAVEWCEFAPAPVRALIREERAKAIELAMPKQTRRVSQSG